MSNSTGVLMGVMSMILGVALFHVGLEKSPPTNELFIHIPAEKISPNTNLNTDSIRYDDKGNTYLYLSDFDKTITTL